MKVGSIVQYVKYNPKDWFLIKLKIGSLYTVREIISKHVMFRSPSGSLYDYEDDVIFLEEVTNTPIFIPGIIDKMECPYIADSFAEVLPPMVINKILKEVEPLELV